jgi:hypothetical protein
MKHHQKQFQEALHQTKPIVSKKTKSIVNQVVTL